VGASERARAGQWFELIGPAAGRHTEQRTLDFLCAAGTGKHHEGLRTAGALHVQRAGDRFNVEPSFGNDKGAALAACGLFELGHAVPHLRRRARQLWR
jgi:hypothetical protein